MNILRYIGLILTLGLMASCATYKHTAYFADVSPRADTLVQIMKHHQAVVSYGDALTVGITTLDQLSSLQSAETPAGGVVPSAIGASAALNAPSGNTYSVNRDGTIELPIVGKIAIGGLTLDSAKEVIRTAYAGYYKNFTLNIGFANHKITILGEVERPGTYSMPSDNTTILDALGMAGDMTIFSKRENVLLLRDTSDSRKHLVRIDMTSKDILTSPFYFMHPNDVIYVEARKEKLANIDAYRTRYLAIITVILSLTLIVLERTN